jgi:hypothetical protein
MDQKSILMLALSVAYEGLAKLDAFNSYAPTVGLVADAVSKFVSGDVPGAVEAIVAALPKPKLPGKGGA